MLTVRTTHVLLLSKCSGQNLGDQLILWDDGLSWWCFVGMVSLIVVLLNWTFISLKSKRGSGTFTRRK